VALRDVSGDKKGLILKRESKISPQVLRDPDLVRPGSNCSSKLQTSYRQREGPILNDKHNYLKIISVERKKN
jgi:hypothetical protein